MEGGRSEPSVYKSALSLGWGEGFGIWAVIIRDGPGWKLRSKVLSVSADITI